MKKMVVPDALRVVRLRPGRSYCRLGDLATLVGWKHEQSVKKLEAKRKIFGKAFYKRKCALRRLRNKAVAKVASDPALKNLNPILQAYGY
jgi:large subunit ribosomal protein L13Ae